MKKNSRMRIVDWINDLFDEIEEPTYIDRVAYVSLLSAEVESWKKDPTIIKK